jgi:deoxyadenosine/deoxycytidine kinase
MLEGSIGAGKTRLAALLASAAHVVVETGDDGLRRLFRAWPDAYAFALQVAMQRERATTLRYESSGLVARARTVLDRSVVGDLAFAAVNAARGNISADEYDAYTSLAGRTVDAALALASAPRAHLTLVYLRSPPDACSRRQTARDGFTIEPAYMAELTYAHELVAEQAARSARARLVVLEWAEYSAATSAADFFELVDGRAAVASAAWSSASAPPLGLADLDDGVRARLDALLGK